MPAEPQPKDVAGIEAAGAHWWPLAMGRERDDAIPHLRTNDRTIGTRVLRNRG